MRRRVAMAVAGAAVLLPAAPAHAEDVIGLSTDGVTWTSDLTDPLFDPQVRWVPGDVRTARFFVRNERPDQGDLSVFVDRAVNGTLRDTGYLDISARAGNRPWMSITDGGRHELVQQDEVDPDVPVPVEVRIAMDADAPNDTMVLSTDLDFSVRLTDSTAVLDDSGEIGAELVDGLNGGPDDPSDGPQTSTGFLPGTGSEIPQWMPPLALLLLGSGSYLVARARRRDDETQGPCADLADQPLST